MTVGEAVKNMKYSQLFKITEEEYNNNCTLAYQRINANKHN